MLLFSDNLAHFEVDALRRVSSQTMAQLPLLRRCHDGDPAAVHMLHHAFWPFVRDFEGIIDSHPFDRRIMPRDYVRGLASHVAEMSTEEGQHAAHWAADYRRIFGPVCDPLSEEPLPAVQALVDLGRTANEAAFYAVLAGTEVVAEELSRYLTESEAFTNLVGRWIWGEVHLAAHDGPSHLEIDLDLTRFYGARDGQDASGVLVETIRRFYDAAAQAGDLL